MTQAIALINGKGGVGKTSTSVGLAASLLTHSTVALLDTDPQERGGATEWLEALDAADKLDGLGYARVEPAKLSEAIAKLSEAGYDYVLVDTPPRLDDVAGIYAITDAVDLSIVPTSLGGLDIAATAQTVASYFLERPYLVALVKIDPRSHKTAERARQELEEHGITTAETIIRRYSAVAAARANPSYPTTADDRHAADLEALAAEVLAALSPRKVNA